LAADDFWQFVRRHVLVSILQLDKATL
jgi:hypothetical protein